MTGKKHGGHMGGGFAHNSAWFAKESKRRRRAAKAARKARRAARG